MTKAKDGGAIEHRSFNFNEVKVAENDGEMTFSGYGAVFGNVDSHGDVIEKGAFAATLKKANDSGQWPAMLSQHGGVFGDSSTPIGVWTEMREDDIGLWIEGKLAPTEKGREAYELLKMKPRPAYSGLSIGFRAKEWARRTQPEDPARTLKVVDLVEVSLVTFPSNGKARVMSVKSEFNPREIEDALRDAGLSRADSVKAVSVFKSALRDEADTETDARDAAEPAGEGDAEAKRANDAMLVLAERIKALTA